MNISEFEASNIYRQWQMVRTCVDTGETWSKTWSTLGFPNAEEWMFYLWSLGCKVSYLPEKELNGLVWLPWQHHRPHPHMSRWSCSYMPKNFQVDLTNRFNCILFYVHIYIYIWAVKIRCISVVAIIGCSFWEGHIAFQCFVPLSLLRGTISLYSVSRTTLTKYSCNWY